MLAARSITGDMADGEMDLTEQAESELPRLLWLLSLQSRNPAKASDMRGGVPLRWQL